LNARKSKVSLFNMKRSSSTLDAFKVGYVNYWVQFVEEHFHKQKQEHLFIIQ